MKPQLHIILLFTVWFSSASLSLTWAQTPSTPSSVVATVNEQAITLGQIDAMAANSLKSATDPEVQLRIRTQALNTLIDQLLVEQAINQSELKDSPEFLGKVTEIRRQAQVNAFVDARLGKLPELTPQAIDQVYRANPDLFEKRRIYHYTVLTFAASDKISLPEVDKTIKVTGVEGLKQRLSAGQMKWSSANNWLSPQQINPAVLVMLKTLADGEVRVEVSPDKKLVMVIKSIASYPDPVSIEDARPTIAKEMMGQRVNQLGRNVLGELRQKANVEIKDATLAAQIQKQNAINKEFKPSSLFDQFKISWLFAMIILVPASLIVFYRSLPTLRPDQEPIPTLMQSIGSVLLPRTNSAINDLNLSKFEGDEDKVSFFFSPIFRAVFVVAMAAWLFQPLIHLFDKIPTWLTLQTLILLAFSGIGGGIVMTLMCWKAPLLKRVFSNRWVGIGLVLAIHRALLLVQF